MRLVLHIGTEKTGTTSLQAWFVANRAALLPHGLRYSTSLGPTSHRYLSVYARDADKPDDGFRQIGIKSPTDHEAFCLTLAATFEREWAEFANTPYWIVSSEHLHSRLTTVKMVERVRQFFGDRFEATEVLVHLRPQIDVAMSLASTGTRTGHHIGPTWFAPKAPDTPYYNYDLLVRRWESVFGPKAVTIIPYKRQPSLIEFLLQKFGISSDALKPPRRANEALDWRSLALINALIADENEKPGHGTVMSNLFVDDWPVLERLEVGLEAARKFQEPFEASNEALIVRRAELSEGDLTPDWSKYERPSRLPGLDSALPFAPQLGYLVTRLRNEMLMERCGRLAAECRLALWRGDIERARALLGEAETSGTLLRRDIGAEKRLAGIGAALDDLRRQIEQAS